jgi:hypothetical protein
VAYGGEDPKPPPDVVHAVHERYLLEVVEELGLCPFARHSRETGRVHRPVLWVDDAGPSAEDAAAGLAAAAASKPCPEIVLLTFVDATGRFDDPDVFDRFVAEVRTRYEALEGPRYFMVGFHPLSGRPKAGEGPRPRTKDTLVPVIRRSPDPVIQCVHGDTLERARAQAQEAAHRRMLESIGDSDPVLRALFERSVHADSQLSSDIAQANFEAVGQDEGRATLEQRLADIKRQRDETYAPYLDGGADARSSG